MLNQNILENPEEIKNQLKQPLIIIENALDESFAENLYTQLLETNNWQQQSTENDLNPEYPSDYSYVRKHIELNSPSTPPLLKELNDYLNSPYIREWFSQACGSPCDTFVGSAAIFNKGGHISEHNDRRIYNDPGEPKRVRTLTFNYYLTKNWQSEWGGNLVWKEPHKIIKPAFNSLVMFNVTSNSHHWVEPVLVDTETKRLSITGWYLTEIKKEKFSLSL